MIVSSDKHSKSHITKRSNNTAGLRFRETKIIESGDFCASGICQKNNYYYGIPRYYMTNQTVYSILCQAALIKSSSKFFYAHKNKLRKNLALVCERIKRKNGQTTMDFPKFHFIETTVFISRLLTFNTNRFAKVKWINFRAFLVVKYFETRIAFPLLHQLKEHAFFYLLRRNL